jgi:hypothetical protein
MEQSALFLGKIDRRNIAPILSRWPSTAHQWLLAMHPQKSKALTTTLCYNWTTGCLSSQKWTGQHRCYVLNVSVSRASLVSSVASWTIKGLCEDINP